MRLVLRLSALLLIVFATGCGNNNAEQREERQKVTTPAEDAPVYYKRFSGMVAGQRVVVHLHRQQHAGDDTGKHWFSLNAIYYYEKQGKPIDISGIQDSANKDHFILSEYDGNRYVDNNAKWDVIVKGDSVAGTWISADGKKRYDIRLKEAYPEGCYRLSVDHKEYIIPYKQGKKEPFATMSITLLKPGRDMDKPEGDFFTDVIQKAEGDSINLGETSVERQKDAYAKYYRETIAEEYEMDSTSTFRYNYYTASAFSVMYNDNGWLILEHTGSDYTGGAHGNYAAGYLNIDMTAQKLWQLTDVIKVDSGILKPLLEKEARRIFSIPAVAPLGEHMLVDAVHVTNNFYICPAGVVFSYTPYEIAAYVAGQPDLFIAYTDIKHLLTPAFKKRMGL